jgi:hypothetical protein
MKDYSVAKWHNIRYTRSLPSGGMVVTSDFEMSLSDAVDTGVFHNHGVNDLVKVEWCGAQGPKPEGYDEQGKYFRGSVWRDMTEAYKLQYHERTHYVS